MIIRKQISYFAILSAMLLFSCSTPSAKSKALDQDRQLQELILLMTGSFSSAEQATLDSSYFDISLTMHPIWESDQIAKWLYVEQAVTEYINKPYRQRVYRVSSMPDGSFESRVYELPEPERFTHAWESPSLFNEITPESLLIREGCAVILRPDKNGCFTGSTVDQNCKSTLRGASYATSIVTVCADQLASWDQGWNAQGEQVWGAVKGGYIFKKK